MDDEIFVEGDQSLPLYFDYQEAFSRSCFDSEAYAWATFHLLVGALPNVRKLRLKRGRGWEDLRVHLTYLCDSAGGKGQGADFAAEVGKKAGVQIYHALQFTDAALIGTISVEDGETKIYGGLFGGQAEIHDPIKDSTISQRVDVICVGEASKVLNPAPTEHDSNLMSSLQTAMNPIGSGDNRVGKKLAKGPALSYPTDVTLMLTTYPPDGLGDVVLKRGLLQRTILVVKEMTHDQRKRVADEYWKSFEGLQGDLYINPITKLPDYRTTEQLMDDVGKKLKEVDDWAHTVRDITMTPEAAKKLHNLTRTFQNQVQSLNPFLQAKVHEFITRMMRHMAVLTAHVAILNKSSTIEPEHVVVLEKFHAKERFEDLITYLSNNILEPKEFRARLDRDISNLVKIQKALAKRESYSTWSGTAAGWRMRGDVESEISIRLGLPMTGARALTARHLAWNNLESKRTESGVFLRVNPQLETTDNGNRREAK